MEGRKMERRPRRKWTSTSSRQEYKAESDNVFSVSSSSPCTVPQYAGSSGPSLPFRAHFSHPHPNTTMSPPGNPSSYVRFPTSAAFHYDFSFTPNSNYLSVGRYYPAGRMSPSPSNRSTPNKYKKISAAQHSVAEGVPTGTGLEVPLLEHKLLRRRIPPTNIIRGTPNAPKRTASSSCSTIKTSPTRSAPNLIKDTHLKGSPLLEEASTSQSAPPSQRVLKTAVSTSVTSTTLPDISMVTDQLLSDAFKEEDIRLFRLRKISDSVFREVLHQVFSEDTKERQNTMSLFQFYEEKRKVNIKKFKSRLDKKQIDLMEKQPNGKDFDVTLLYKCLNWGSAILAKADTEPWEEGKGRLESYITAVKNRRNDLVHPQTECTSQKFAKKIEEYTEILKEIIKLVGDRYQVSEEKLARRVTDMLDNITAIKDSPLLLKNLSECVETVKKEGRSLLCKLYESWVIITPISFLYGRELKLKVNKIFTEMVLKGEGVNCEQKFEDIFKGILFSSNDPIILIEGMAGAGKTTLTKKILQDWAAGKSTIEGLNSYDLLLYSECRNNSIGSFKELIQALMQQIANIYKDDLVQLIFNQKVLIIFDGLDELNPTSMGLFLEVLHLKKTYSLNVLATTRPEKLVSYFDTVKSLDIKTKHIKLIGITNEKRDNFVKRYHDEMMVCGFSKRDIGDLLEYLQKTSSRLGDIWMLPINLVFLIILFVEDPANIADISTAPELFWKIHHMIRKKLIERLKQNIVTRGLLESFLDEKTKCFCEVLCKKALMGLQTDNINLTKDTYLQLVKICNDQKIPAEEMIGAYLRQVVVMTPDGHTTKHSFPHKGFQEFLGALTIFNEINAILAKKHDAKEEFSKLCKKYSLPTTEIVELIERLKLNPSNVHSYAGDQYFKSSIIIDHLQSVCGSRPNDLSKYQNLIITLIGMLFMESDKIPESIKREALELLRDSGVTDCIGWLRVLMAVKYDPFVGSFMSTLYWVTKGVIEIDKIDLSTYISLLKALDKIPVELKHVTINLNVEGEFLELEEILDLVKRHQLRVSQICITESNMMEYSKLLQIVQSVLTQDHGVTVMVTHDSPVIKDFFNQLYESKFVVRALKFDNHYRSFPTDFPSKNEVVNLFEGGKIDEYKGAYISGMKIPSSVTKLIVSIAYSEDLKDLQEYLASGFKKQLEFSFAPGVNFAVLPPVSKTGVLPQLYLPDLNGSNYLQAYSEVNEQKKRKKTRNKYWRIYFPRCSLNVEEISTLITHLGQANVSVEDRLFFPKALDPPLDEQRRLLSEVAENLHTKHGVDWGFDGEQHWEERSMSPSSFLQTIP